MTRAPPRKPLIAIIGATGTGKSQLAVDIAKQYNGEIINGDATQLYAGLPIITNKITVEEQQGITHHFLGCIALHEQTWVVGTFVRNALRTIDEIRSRGKLPILVGGTHYYTQSLLFQDRLLESNGKEKHEFVEDTAEKWPILREPTEVLLAELNKVDPAMANRWHPNDRRKIQRSLEIYLQTGKTASEIYAEQRVRRSGLESHVEGTSSQPSLRFPTLILWVHTEIEALRSRLDQRVEKMLDAGLLQEVEFLSTFADEQAAAGGAMDETKGIWVSIGYKEFKDYIRALRKGDSNDQQQLSKLKKEAIERTQIATRQYAKRQLRWIRIKLLGALAESDSRSQDLLYLLDGSDLAQFHPDVVQPALDLTRQFLLAEDRPSPPSLSPAAAQMLTPQPQQHDGLAAAPERGTKQYCTACDVTCVTTGQWQQHTGSKTHKKLVAKQKRAAESVEAPS